MDLDFWVGHKAIIFKIFCQNSGERKSPVKWFSYIKYSIYVAAGSKKKRRRKSNFILLIRQSSKFITRNLEILYEFTKKDDVNRMATQIEIRGNKKFDDLFRRITDWDVWPEVWTVASCPIRQYGGHAIYNTKLNINFYLEFLWKHIFFL